jgi:hypothetical protein
MIVLAACLQKNWRLCMQLAASAHAKFACDWRPLGYNLNATNRQSHAIFACDWRPVVFKAASFCKHVSKTIIWIKKWRRHLKIQDSTRHMSLLSAIHQHYAWPDPNSWDSSFKNFKLFLEPGLPRPQIWRARILCYIGRVGADTQVRL